MKVRVHQIRAGEELGPGNGVNRVTGRSGSLTAQRDTTSHRAEGGVQ